MTKSDRGFSPGTIIDNLRKDANIRWLKYRQQITRMWALFKTSKLGIIGLIIILFFAYIAIFAPFFMPYNPKSPFTGQLYEDPSLEHPLGTDNLGRDIFSRIIYGSRLSIIIGITASFIGVFIGTIIGLVSGYTGGKTDLVLMRFTDLVIQLPTLPLMLILVVFIRNNIIYKSPKIGG
ncbi:MAG: ABC transporter permease [Candidatus Hodarchaeota archaeon]